MENYEKEQAKEQAKEQENAVQPDTIASKEKALSKSQQFFRDARDVLYILAIFMLVYVLFFRAVVVVGDSMFDTLANGDKLLLISNTIYRNPKQGDIIVASKDSFRGGECIVKRVIATEGQTVDIDFKTGTVYVDGEAITEAYLYTGTYTPEGVSFPLTVDTGCVFVMGDNRMKSKDSRNPEIGLIDEREILGKVIFLMFPGTGTDNNPIAFDFGRIGVVN